MLKIPCIAAITIALAATCTFAAPPAQFTPRGIGGGGAMYAPTINPANPLEMSVACDMSPQFTTTDGGKSWSLIDFRQFLSGHECTVRYTRDPKIRWTIDYTTHGGDDSARPTRTIDGGKTWHPVQPRAWPLDRKAYVLYADYDSPDRAIISADYGDLYLTTDGGQNFVKKLTGIDKETGLHLAGVFFDGPTIYACLNDGLYLSTDNGGSFQKSEAPGLTPGAFITSFAAGKSNGGTRLACVVHKKGWAGMTSEDVSGYVGVYTLDPGQKAWQLKTNGLPKTAAPFFVRMAANDPETLYVAGGNLNTRTGPSVCKSTNGGANWTDVFLTAGNKNISVAWAGDDDDFGWSFPEYALGFDISALDKNHLIVTDLSCAHASDDGGKTWRQVYTTPATAHASGQAPRHTQYTSNGMEVTSVWQVLWFDPNNLFACATDIRGFRSTDAGKSWSFNYSGHSLNTMYAAVTDSNTKTTYAAVSSVHDLYQSTYLQDKRIDSGKGGVLATTDKGATWSPVGNIGKPVISVAVDPKTPGRLYAAIVSSTAGGIYMTSDAAKGIAAKWTKLEPPPRTQGHPHNLMLLEDGALLATYSGRRDGNKFTPSSGVFLSSDQGKTWEDRTDYRMRYWTKDVVIDPADKSQNTWYAGVFHAWGKSAADGEAGLYRTTDRGQTWTQLATSPLAKSGILNVESAAFDPAHPGQFYFTTEYDGLYFSPDIRARGSTFTQVQSYPFKHPLRVQFNPAKPTEMWVTSFGNAIRVGETLP